MKSKYEIALEVFNEYDKQEDRPVGAEDYICYYPYWLEKKIRKENN